MKLLCFLGFHKHGSRVHAEPVSKPQPEATFYLEAYCLRCGEVFEKDKLTITLDPNAEAHVKFEKMVKTMNWHLIKEEGEPHGGDPKHQGL